MTLAGRFGDTSGRPYVEGILYFPRFKLKGEVSFLVDTGADRSIISPSDTLRLGVNFDLLSDESESLGIGGALRYFNERALLVFTSTDKIVHIYDVPVGVIPLRNEYLSLPSLLGRDVIDRWRMVYDPQTPLLEFDIRSADLTMSAEELGRYGSP